MRAAVKEQVQSLGAKFLEVEGSADAEAAGGYARELTEEEQQAQRDALAAQIAKSDVVITTALVPGRPAPKLVTADAVERDEAGQRDRRPRRRGGRQLRAEPSRGRPYTTDRGVTIAAPLNLPSRWPSTPRSSTRATSQSLLELMTGEDGALTLDFDDEIIAGACITRDGEIVHEGAKQGRRGELTLMDLLTELAILVLAAFVGFEVISKVPNTLHTPLMSATNAIHGIVLLGAILVIGPGRRLPQRAPARDRDRVRHDQRRRRLPRHRPDARHVQGPQARPEARPSEQ